jgi:hypothetical protein
MLIKGPQVVRMYVLMSNGAVDTAYNFCFVTKDLVLGSNDHKN